MNFIKIWPVKIAVWGSLNVQVPFTDIIDCLVVDHEGAVWVLQGGVGSQDRVVGFNHSSGNLPYKTVNFLRYLRLKWSIKIMIMRELSIIFSLEIDYFQLWFQSDKKNEDLFRVNDQMYTV